MPGSAKTVTRFGFMAVFAGLVAASSGRLFGALQGGPEAETKKGQVLYAQYCRSCHGDDAKGDGPAASALKVRPTDLTRIEKKYSGFPADKVMDSIDGEKYIVGHGSREMPVWGRRFRRSPGGEKGSQSEIALLTKYLESIQQH